MSDQPIIAINSEAVAAAQAILPPERQLAIVVEMFGALADPTRARMLYALTTGELCVRDLALVVGVSESAVSHQLRLLRERRMIRSRRKGTTIYYALDNHHLPVLFREAEYHADHVRQGPVDRSDPTTPETA
ncbi:MAG TPA: metalloregulator ArsR/SmtB family transcription factor [Ktedonobacterales bacterium]|nr:metalloregulator ArsR/SmtB family transcription factor [Ktedonobacterales bacterium]